MQIVKTTAADSIESTKRKTQSGPGIVPTKGSHQVKVPFTTISSQFSTHSFIYSLLEHCYKSQTVRRATKLRRKNVTEESNRICIEIDDNG